MKKYYLHNGSENVGPFDLENLKTQQLKKDTPIWHEGIDSWTTAGQIEELNELLIVAPPAFIRSEKQTVAPSQTKIGLSVLWKALKLGAIIGAIVLTLFVLIQIINGINSDNEANDAAIEQFNKTPEEREAENPSQYLTSKGNYNENLIGDKIKITGVITNNATYATYKDIVLEITYYSKTDTPLNTINYTVYEFVAPGASVPFKHKVKNYNNVGRINWRVVNADVK